MISPNISIQKMSILGREESTKLTREQRNELARRPTILLLEETPVNQEKRMKMKRQTISAVSTQTNTAEVALLRSIQAVVNNQ